MHGSDLLEHPPPGCPHGKANEEAKSAVLEKLPGIIKRMRTAMTDSNIEIRGACIGQGLIHIIDEIKDVLPDLNLSDNVASAASIGVPLVYAQR